MNIRNITRSAIGLVALTAASIAHAIPVQYDWTGTTNADSWSATGSIVLDDSLYGTTLNANTQLDDWSFSWTNGMVNYFASKSNGDTFRTGTARITLDATGTMTSFLLATPGPDFDPTQTQGLVLSLNYFTPSYPQWWNVYHQGDWADFGFTNSMSIVQAPTPVSAPPIVALFGAGLLAFGTIRRKKIKG